MKNILKIVALVGLLGGLLAVCLPDDPPPCPGGVNPKNCFVHMCDPPANCTLFLPNHTTTTTCTVWCCPIAGGYFAYPSHCGTPVADGCCYNLTNGIWQIDNPPVCPAGGG